MGFQRKRKTVTLSFLDPEFEGFRVEMRRMSIDDSFLFDGLKAWEAAIAAGDVPKPEVDERLRKMHQAVADAIVSWNLETEKDGDPVPPSVAAIRAEDPDFFWTLVHAWILAMRIRVDDDTKAPSSDGKPSEELQMETAVVSTSRAS
ncbi:hypothetical protein VA596_41715 [Amycolatopsis sp., V23-08]|uniref:Tail assembly chaperone n=1 Tax=Amycolatopsis heterodermiae TaxID=3110235 RepID=A0ABU5RIJ0_9PSEU|nr:hypothetical protein [Amycolatopsis sp., V23-08]MEA5366105.1 hypothetical protein [Amycolatopsis sp., V23-08]